MPRPSQLPFALSAFLLVFCLFAYALARTGVWDIPLNPVAWAICICAGIFTVVTIRLAYLIQVRFVQQERALVDFGDARTFLRDKRRGPRFPVGRIQTEEQALAAIEEVKRWGVSL